MCTQEQGVAIFNALSLAVVTLLLSLLTDAACEDPAAVLMQELMLPICKARLEAAAGLLVSCHCSHSHPGSMFRLHAGEMRWPMGNELKQACCAAAA